MRHWATHRARRDRSLKEIAQMDNLEGNTMKPLPRPPKPGTIADVRKQIASPEPAKTTAVDDARKAVRLMLSEPGERSATKFPWRIEDEKGRFYAVIGMDLAVRMASVLELEAQLRQLVTENLRLREQRDKAIENTESALKVLRNIAEGGPRHGTHSDEPS